MVRAHVFFTCRADPNKAKRQKRHELKRAAEWENVTGVITGGQAALDKAVRRTQPLPLPALSDPRWSRRHGVPSSALACGHGFTNIARVFCVSPSQSQRGCTVYVHGVMDALNINFLPEKVGGWVNARHIN